MTEQGKTKLTEHMSGFGGACRRQHLYNLGYSKRQVQRAVASGELIAPSKSWVALPTVNEFVQKALGMHGLIAGATALLSYGVWVTHHDGLCIAVKPGSHYLADAGVTRIECLFDTDPRAPWRVGILHALAQHVQRAPRNDAVASIDSALHKRLIAPSDLAVLMQLLPKRCRPWLKRANGKAESGLETILRLACEDEDWDVQVQVPYRGGRVDLVINGWLYVEVDGSKYHDVAEQAAKDRARNNALATDGYRWHRFSYADIVHSLDASIRLLRTLLSQGDPRPAV